jgi:hypothetical protein
MLIINPAFAYNDVASGDNLTEEELNYLIGIRETQIRVPERRIYRVAARRRKSYRKPGLQSGQHYFGYFPGKRTGIALLPFRRKEIPDKQ